MLYFGDTIYICGLHLAIAVSPGPNTVAICCSASMVSRRAGLSVAAGVVTATGLWAGMALLGAGAAVARHEHLLVILRISSGVYLTGIGLRMLVTPPAWNSPRACGQPFLLGLLTALSNPVALAFWLGTFLTAMPPTATDRFYATIFALIILQSTAWYFLLAVLSSSTLPGRVFGAARSLRQIGAGTMILIGLNALIAH